MIQECKFCLYNSLHPFGITFDNEKKCSGCKTHQEKFDLNWESRFNLLYEKAHKLKGLGDYNCIIPIKGTPENFYLVDVVKNKLKLNPLCVTYNSQFNSKVGIKNLDLIRDIFDVDLYHYTSNPKIYKKLIRESLSKINSIRWPYIAGEKQFPVLIATELKIPLIIWPFHQPTEQVGVHSYKEEYEMTRRSRHEYDLMSIEPHELINVGSLISESDIYDINYPKNSLLLKHKIRGIYLDNYLPWDSRKYSEKMIKKFGACSASNPRTFDTYDRIDDKTYMTIHDILKHMKLGYSRVTDNLCREIRFKRISKKDALNIQKYYQVFYPEKEIDYFLNWLGMEKKAFEWYLKRLPFYNEEYGSKVTLSKTQIEYVNSYINTDGEVHDKSDYIVFGKGISI